MALDYTVEPGKLNPYNNDEVIPVEPGKEELYSVNVKGITSFYNEGKSTNHLLNFPDQASAQAFSQHLQDNAPALESLKNNEPVTVAGVRYSLSESGDHYVADGNRAAGYQMPYVWPWEIRRYLEMGTLTPELAANATAHPENLAGLNDFDKQALLNFADSARQDPHFSDSRKLEREFYRRMGSSAESGIYSIDDLPKGLRKFIQHPDFPQSKMENAEDKTLPSEFQPSTAPGADKLPELIPAGPGMENAEDKTLPSEFQPSIAPSADKLPELIPDGPGMENAPQQSPGIASPIGGLDIAGMAEGATILYSRADAPEKLCTGVLMHNQDTANGQRLDVLNNEGLHERLYTGPDQGTESPHNRIAAVVGYITPTDELLFVAGVGADGKIVDKPQDAQSFGVFHHDENGQAVPVGQAVTMDLAEQLKTQIEQGRAPEPVASLETVATLSALREMLDLPPEVKPDLAPDQAQPKAEKPESDTPKSDTPKDDPAKPQQQQVVHQHVGLISSLLMHTANMGRGIARAIRGPDADEWQHRAHAHLDRAQTHLDAIARHPAVMEYQNINNMPNMPDQAKAMYADTLLRKNPDLQAHYAQAADSVEKAQDAAFMMNKKNGRTDPALLEKASKVNQTAGKLPDMEAGASGGLFSKLASFFTAQQGQTMRKP